MKKLCIILALLLALCTLCACPRAVEETATTGTTIPEPTTMDPALIEAYKPIQDELARLVRAKSDDNDAWEALGINEVPYEFEEGSLGSAVKDINGDGIPELLLLDKMNTGSQGQPFIYALYTLKDREPVMLGQYWSRSRAHLDVDGRLFTVGSSSASSTYLDSYELRPGASELTHLTQYYSDAGGNGKQFYVMVNQGREDPLSEHQFDTLVGLYENPAHLMRFEFIPAE